MKILYLNILKGCPEAVRLERIVDFVKKQNPDVLGLSELNNWDKNDCAILESFKAQTGLSHCVFANSINTSYHLALFSKSTSSSIEPPIQTFRNAAVGVSVFSGPEPLQIFLFHLSPINEDSRLLELETLFQKIKLNKPAILIGDMNSLSPQDDYKKQEVLAQMKQTGIKKFGAESLRFEAIQKILDYGFIDAVKKFHSGFEYSVPTPYNRDKEHFTKLRLDYIFVSPDLEKNLKSAEIIRDIETNQLSDHFPVAAEFDF
ncbi:MAG: endonuclease/exonuclease/phosphatase family protein [bacterium]|nr:endonuclease/exonuclease/phosphatase family protein [bacterium]